MRRALWIGGPQGRVLKNIKKNLKGVGVEVTDTVFSGKCPNAIPKSIDLVLINLELVSHNLANKSIALAIKQNVDWCCAAMSTSTTKKNLEDKGLIEMHKTEQKKEKPTMTSTAQPQATARPPTPPTPPTPEFHEWVLFLHKGSLFIHRPYKTGRLVRSRPVVIDGTVYLSQTAARTVYGCAASTISKALTDGVYHSNKRGKKVDLLTGYPTADQICTAFPGIEIDGDLLEKVTAPPAEAPPEDLTLKVTPRAAPETKASDPPRYSSETKKEGDQAASIAEPVAEAATFKCDKMMLKTIGNISSLLKSDEIDTVKISSLKMFAGLADGMADGSVQHLLQKVEKLLDGGYQRTGGLSHGTDVRVVALAIALDFLVEE